MSHSLHYFPFFCIRKLGCQMFGTLMEMGVVGPTTTKIEINDALFYDAF